MNLFDPTSPLNYYQGFGVGSDWRALNSLAWVWIVLILSALLLLITGFRWRYVRAAGVAALFGYSALPCLVGAFGSVFQFHHFYYLARSGWPGALGSDVFIYMTWSTHIGLFSSFLLFIVFLLLRTLLRIANTHGSSSTQVA